MRSRFWLLVLPLALGGCKQQPPAPSFSKEILPVFQLQCASAKGCHGAEPNDWIDLDLRPDKAHAQLVGHAAYERDNALRVKPGSPDDSFLIAKLTGRLRPREGKPMPLDPMNGQPLRPSPVSEEFIEKTLKPWIAAGAPSN